MQEEKKRYINVYMGAGMLLLVLKALNIFPEAFGICVEQLGIFLFFVAFGVYCREEKIIEQDIGILIKNSARQFLVPYFWISLWVIVGNCIAMLAVPEAVSGNDVIEMIWGLLSCYGGEMLWLLPVFFVVAMGYPFLRKFLKFPVVLVATAILAVVICQINGIPKYLFGKSMTAEVFLLRLAYVIWHGCVGMFFCAVGEGIGMLSDFFHKRKILMILCGFGFMALGVFLALQNREIARQGNITVSFRYLMTGNLIFYFGSSFLLCTGLLLLCMWINVCSPLEYIGQNYRILLTTYLDFAVVNLARIVGDSFFSLVDHDFLRKVIIIIVTAGVEIMLLWLFRGFLWFMFGERYSVKQKNRKE